VAYLATKAELVPAVEGQYRVDAAADMVRMHVDREAFRPVLGDAVRLDAADARHLTRLYELGLTASLPSEAVASGVYFGVRRGTRLIAAAGTHVISPMFGVAAVGNVFTPQCRGQGSPRSSPAVTSQAPAVDDVVASPSGPPRRLRATAIAAYALRGRTVTAGSLWDSIIAPIRRTSPTGEECMTDAPCPIDTAHPR
jgi:hypothetical protein